MTKRKNRDEDEKEPKEKPEATEPDDQGDVEIEVAGEEEDDEDDAVEIEEPKPTRMEKKRQRGNAHREALERAAAAEARAAQLEQERQQYFQQQQIAQQQQQQKTQAEQEWEQLQKEIQDTFAGFEQAGGANASEATRAEYTKRAQNLELKKHAIMMKLNGAGQQIDPRQIAAYVEQSQLQAKYADIFGNDAALRWGQGRLHQLAAERGLTAQTVTKAQYYELLDEAAEETRRRFGMGNRRRPPPPSEATKQRYSGVPSRTGGNDGSVKVVMDRDRKRIAESLYPDDPPQKAWQKWANGPGKRAALAERNSR